MRISGWIGGATAASVVGASFPVSEALVDYPFAASQCVRYLLGAIILTALLKGRLGRADLALVGLLLAAVALLCEVGFTLLAAPLLPRLGPVRVAAWAAWLATAQLALLATFSGGIPVPDAGETAAIVYLAVITTALAFVLWFGAVQQLGADRAGLLVGLMPVAALAVDAVLNGHAPTPADLAGTAIVAAGVALGARRAPLSRGPRASLKRERAPLRA